MITAITQHRKAGVAWGIQGCVLVAIGLGQPASMAEATEALADLRAANALIKKTSGDGHPDTLKVLARARS